MSIPIDLSSDPRFSHQRSSDPLDTSSLIHQRWTITLYLSRNDSRIWKNIGFGTLQNLVSLNKTCVRNLKRLEIGQTYEVRAGYKCRRITRIE